MILNKEKTDQKKNKKKMTKKYIVGLWQLLGSYLADT